MSIVEFQQEARYQGCLHIALKPLGEVSGSLFSTVVTVLQGLPPIQLPEPKGTVLFLRFMDDENLPGWAVTENAGRRWNLFTAHKSVVGLLCISHCHDEDELANIKAGYKNACTAHSPRPFGSKCIVYGKKKTMKSFMGGPVSAGEELVYIDQGVGEEGEEVTTQDIHVHRLEELVNELVHSIFSKLNSRKKDCQRLFDEGRLDLKAPVEPAETLDEDER